MTRISCICESLLFNNQLRTSLQNDIIAFLCSPKMHKPKEATTNRGPKIVRITFWYKYRSRIMGSYCENGIINIYLDWTPETVLGFRANFLYCTLVWSNYRDGLIKPCRNGKCLAIKHDQTLCWPNIFKIEHLAW